MKHEFSLMMSNLEMLYAGFEEVYFLLKFQFSSFSIDFILQDKQNMHTLSEYKIYLYSAHKRLEIICKLHIYICSIQITVYSETMYVYSICIIKQSEYNIVCHINCNLFSHVIDIEQYLCLYICRIS